MEIIYNKELKGWQIIHLPNQFIRKEIWNKPINDMIFDSWEDASSYLDKIAE